MEYITNSLQTLEIETPLDDIDMSSNIMSHKYGIIVIIVNNHLFTPTTFSFKNFKINIHTTSILLKNNQLVIFEDTNQYMLQYRMSTDYNIHSENIRQIVTTEYGNINLYCVILYNSDNTDIKIDDSYNWNHFCDFVDSDIYKYTSLYKYLVDSNSRDMNHHLQKEITINYMEIGCIQPFVIKLYDIYKCLE